MYRHEIDSKSLAAYLPRTLTDYYRRHPGDQSHILSRHRGILIFMDVTGFTQLTKELSAREKTGPEILTELLNDFFGSISSVIHEYGGDILKLAGDGIWAYFDHDVPLDRFQCSAGSELVRVNRRHHKIVPVPLEMHTGGEFGDFYLASLGDPSSRIEIVPMGKLAVRVMELSDRASAGRFLIGPELAGRIKNTDILVYEEGGLFTIKQAMEVGFRTDMEIDKPELPMEDSADSRCMKYLPPGLIKKYRTLAEGAPLQSEYRQVAVLFVNFDFDFGKEITTESIVALNGLLSEIFVIIHDSGGSIARIDPCTCGHKLLVLYGAPQRIGDDELKAVHAARNISRIAAPHLRMRIGLAGGSLFCGEVGGARRCEYTVIGESVNLAARLMGKAEWSEIIFDENLRQLYGPQIRSEAIELDLKGIKSPVTACKLTGFQEYADQKSTKLILAGRKRELGILQNCLSDVTSGRKHAVMIVGEPGIGKTALIGEFLDRSTIPHNIKISCRHSILFGQGWLARKLIEEVFSLRKSDIPSNLVEYVREQVGEEWLPLLSEVTCEKGDDNPWTKGLTPELKHERSKEMFIELVEGLIKEPVIVAIDDFDRADEFSRDLILAVAEDRPGCPLMLVLSSRGDPNKKANPPRLLQEITLVPPGEENWLEYLGNIFSDGKREDELIELLLKKSGGNPMFVTEFINRSIEEKTIERNKISGRLELKKTELDLNIPSSLAELHLSRFDRLPETERDILKAASVAGGEFTLDVIAAIMPGVPRIEIERYLDGLVGAGILYYSPTSAIYEFTHGTMREVVYSCLPESKLRSLHAKYGTMMEGKDAGAHAGLLAYHFMKAARWDNAFKYGQLAAIRAIETYSLNEAYHFFNGNQALIEKGRLTDIGPEEIFSHFRDFASLSILDGRFQDAFRILRDWRHKAERQGDSYQFLKAAAETANLMWRQCRYSKSRKVLSLITAVEAVQAYPDILARGLNTLAELERRSGAFALAREYCGRAIEAAEAAGDFRLLADALNNLGLAQWGEGMLDAASESYRKSLEIIKGHDGKYPQAQAANNLAIIYWEKGDFNEAEKLMAEARDIFRNTGDRRNRAYVSGNLSSLNRITGKLDSARRLLMEAGEVFEEIGDRHARYYVIGNTGDIDLFEGKLAEAERRFRQTYEFASDVGDKELIAETLARLGELYFFRDDLETAEDYYLRAIRAASRIDSKEYFIRAHIGLGRLMIGRRNPEAALESIRAVQKKSQEIKSTLTENEAAFLRGEHARIRGLDKEAVSYYDRVLAYAAEQKIFELKLKCASRIYELEHNQRDRISRIIAEVRADFIKDNSLRAWIELVSSPYFKYFRSTLRRFQNVSE